MTIARPTTIKAAFELVMAAPSYDDARLAQRLHDLVAELNPKEAEELPEALGATLRLFRAEPDKAVVLANLIVQLDAGEALGDLASLVRELPVAGLIFALASLTSSPSAREPEVFAARATLGDVARQVSGGEHMVQVRLDPRTEPIGSLEVLARAQSWPGFADPDLAKRISPPVYLEIAGVDARTTWMIATALVARGASVRRFADTDPSKLAPEWFMRGSPIVGGSQSTIGVLRGYGLPADASNLIIPDGALTRLSEGRLINRVARALPSGLTLRSTDDDTLLREGYPLSRQGLEQGAFDVAEVAFLATARKRSVYQFDLVPTHADVQRWSFVQLLAIRMVQFFKQQSARRLAPDASTLIKSLERATEAASTSRIGVAADGAVFITDSDDQFLNIVDGQQPFEPVVELDDVFRPFRIGGGHIPALLEPSLQTSVHPARAFGTPVIADSRVPARAVAELATQYGEESVRVAYPELSWYQLEDAIRVGKSILYVK